MVCFDNNQNVTTVNRNDSIVDLLKKIEKMQNEAIIANRASNCNTCVISPMYNTKPIAIYLCNGVLEGFIDNDENTTNLFRVEEVRGNDTVLLRLLAKCNGEVRCTDMTIIVKISCICCVQCFDSINCKLRCMLLQA